MEYTVGISFSKTHCFVAQMTREKNAYTLTNVWSFMYENNLFSALKTNANSIKNNIPKSSRVVVVLPSSDILLQHAALDAALTDAEIMRYIQSQSPILFGHAPEKLCIDYETHYVEDNHRHIIIAACLQNTVSCYQQCFNELNLPLDTLDIDVFALCRLLEFSKHPDSSTLLFHQDPYLQVITTRHKKPQKSELFDLLSNKAFAHLHAHQSENNQYILISEDCALKKQLSAMDFLYEELDISWLQNQTSMPSLHSFFISLGACLWSTA